MSVCLPAGPHQQSRPPGTRRPTASPHRGPITLQEASAEAPHALFAPRQAPLPVVLSVRVRRAAPAAWRTSGAGGGAGADGGLRGGNLGSDRAGAPGQRPSAPALVPALARGEPVAPRPGAAAADAARPAAGGIPKRRVSARLLARAGANAGAAPSSSGPQPRRGQGATAGAAVAGQQSRRRAPRHVREAADAVIAPAAAHAVIAPVPPRLLPRVTPPPAAPAPPARLPRAAAASHAAFLPPQRQAGAAASTAVPPPRRLPGATCPPLATAKRGRPALPGVPGGGRLQQ